MARCKECIHNKVCLHKANIQTDTYAYMGVSYDTESCKHFTAADVAPKSEFYRVYNELEHLKSSILPRLRTDLQMANTWAYDVEKENDRLRQICHSYALQYGTVTDQQKVIDKAKAEVIEEIEREIDSIRGLNFALQSLDHFIAELKKKYTEESNEVQHS